MDFALMIWRHRSLVLGTVVVAVLATLLVTITMPRIYQSTVTVIAPKEGPSAGLLGGLAGSVLLQQIPALSVPSLSPNRDLLLSVLKSRTVALAVVQRFGLQTRYGERYLEDAIRRLQASTAITVSREGVIAVRSEDTDPALAAEMANLYVEELDRLVAKYSTGEAGRQRVFLTEQAARARADLDATEQRLRRFQEHNRAIVLHEQTRGAIEAAARLKGEIMAAEVQLQVIRSFATEVNPEVIAVRRRIDEMNRQLGRMQYGEALARPATDVYLDFNLPFTRVPEVALELARLTRDVKVQETLVSLLTQQLEQARIVEAKDMPVVQVLDRAVPAERPARPRLALNLTLGGVTSLLLASGLAMLIDTANIRR